MTINMRRKKIRITPGKALMLLFFAWFILACLVLPNLNLLKTVFFADGNFSTEPIRKLLKSKRAMKALRNSFILAPTLSITVGFVGITLVLLTEYFDIKGANILRLGYMTTLIYGGITLVSGYKFIYGSSGFLTKLLVQVFPNMNASWFQGYGAVLFVMTFSCTSNHMIFCATPCARWTFRRWRRRAIWARVNSISCAALCCRCCCPACSP